jgi:hypothetical protein
MHLTEFTGNLKIYMCFNCAFCYSVTIMHSVETKPDLFSADYPQFITDRNQVPEQDSTQILSPSFVRVTKPALAPEERFTEWLELAKKEADPFKALIDKTSDVFAFQLNSGQKFLAKLREDIWDSTAFAQRQPGKFRYIELYEYDSNSNSTLLHMRMSQDHSEGEWLWVRRGETISGNQVKAVAERISSAMRIQQCYLADTSKVKSSEGYDIAISVGLKVMQGYGYYGPRFTLVSTQMTPSDIMVNGRRLIYNQNPKKHQRDIKWLQNLSIQTVSSEVLADASKQKKRLMAIAKRANLAVDATLQALFKTLYAKRNASKQATIDYEWANFNLLVPTNITQNSTFQRKYAKITKDLELKMLHCASF